MLPKKVLTYLYVVLFLCVSSNTLVSSVCKDSGLVRAYADQLDQDTITFLRLYEVDNAVADTLTAIMRNPEIQKHVSCIYTGNQGNIDLINRHLSLVQDELSVAQGYYYKDNSCISKLKAQEQFYNNALTDAQLILQASKMALTEYGFTFLDDKYHIFTLQQLPGYVFKMALPWDGRDEALNASRIKFAQLLRAVICKNRLKIRIPKKWVYFVAAPKDYVLPLILVIAQMIDMSNQQPLSEELHDHIDTLIQETGFHDDHSGNVIGCGDYAVIVDTEEITRSYHKKFLARTWHDVNHIFADLYTQIVSLI